MIKLRLVLLLMLACVLLPASASQAQNEDVLTREEDESAITTEERESALKTLLIAARQFRNAGDASKAARLLNRAGRLQLKLNSAQDATATYLHALKILKRPLDPSTNIDSLNGLGTAYNHLSKCEEAQTVLQQAISLSEQNGYTAGKAEALLPLSDCQNNGDLALALRTAQESLALWQSINNKRGIAKAYTIIADYQLTQNNLSEATQTCTTALNLWRELNDPNGQAEALIILGYIEYRKGAWQNVLDFLRQAQKLLDENAEPYMMGQINAGFADAFVESGMPETGLDKYHQALAYYQQARSQQGVIAMTWGLGRTYYMSGRYPEALEKLQAALADAELITYTKVAALCHDFLGQTFAAMQDNTAALHHFEVALNLYTRIANPMEAARVRALIGQVYQRQGKVEKAREYYQKALEIFIALSDQVNQSTTLYALGNLELKQNKLDIAEDYLRQSIEVTENMRRVSSSSDLTAAFSATVYERYEKYIECLMHQREARPEQELAVRAFETSELARGRSLAELLQATETNLATGVDPQLAGQEKSLRQALRVKEDSKVALLSREYKKEELDALELELRRLETEYKQVTETIRARYPSYEQITRPTALTLRQIQEQVVADEQTVLLEYSLGDDKSYVWAVTRHSIQSYELPARAEITGVAEQVYKLLATQPAKDGGSESTLPAQQLSRMILSPVASELNKRRIIVVPDGALNYIPFQVLPNPAGNDEQLLDGLEVVNAPSASILGELRQEAARRQPAAKVLAAFGDPVFADNYAAYRDANGNKQMAGMLALEAGRLHSALRDIELNGNSFDPSVIKQLFYAKIELANLREMTTAGEALVAADFAATRQQLLNTDLTQYAILHFATHGFLNPIRPENSGLVLSTVDRAGQEQNGFVGLRDIYELRAPVELVVLSACQTALGKDVRGEGLMGLTRGFMYAGASSVVASLWKVDDEATAELMKQFYANMLQKGMPTAEALREAQKSIRQNPKWRSPYYWAAFTLQGEYRNVIQPRHAAGSKTLWRNIIFGGVLLIALAGVAWWYHRRRLGATPEHA